MVHGTCSCIKCSYRRALAARGAVPFLAIVEADGTHAVELWQNDAKKSEWPFDDVEDARDAIPSGLKRIDQERSRPPRVLEVWA